MSVLGLLDIITLVIVGIFVIVGIWKGFLKTVFKLGATFFAVILAKFFGAPVGRMLLPEVIKSDSGLGSKLSSNTLANINSSISSIVGTLILFIVLFIILRIISGILAKAFVKGFRSKTLDRLLGAVLGLVLAAGVIYVFALVVELFALAITFIDPSSTFYSAIESTVIFKYFI